MPLQIERGDYLFALATLHGLRASPMTTTDRFTLDGKISDFDRWALAKYGRYSWVSLEELVYDYCCFYELGGLSLDD